MDHSQDREAFIRDEFSTSSTTGLCRVRGIHGANDSDVRQHVDVPRKFKSVENYAASHPEQNTPATLALFASHVQAIAAAFDAGHAAALIVEDDVLPLLPQLWDFAIDDLLHLIPQTYPLKLPPPAPFYEADRGFSTACVLAAAAAEVAAADAGAAEVNSKGKAASGDFAEKERKRGAEFPGPTGQIESGTFQSSLSKSHAAGGGALLKPLPVDFGHWAIRDALSALGRRSTLKPFFEALRPQSRRGRFLWENFRGLPWRPYAVDSGGGGRGNSRFNLIAFDAGNSGAEKSSLSANSSYDEDINSSHNIKNFAAEENVTAMEVPASGSNAGTSEGPGLDKNEAVFDGQDWDVVRVGYGWPDDSLWACNQRHGSAVGVGCTANRGVGSGGRNAGSDGRPAGSDCRTPGVPSVAAGARRVPFPHLPLSPSDDETFREGFAEFLKQHMPKMSLNRLKQKTLARELHIAFEIRRLINFAAHRFGPAASEVLTAGRRGNFFSFLHRRTASHPDAARFVSDRDFALRAYLLEHCLPPGLVEGRKARHPGGNFGAHLKRMNVGRCPFDVGSEPPPAVLPPTVKALPETESPLKEAPPSSQTPPEAKKPLEGAPPGADRVSAATGEALPEPAAGLAGTRSELQRQTVPVRMYHPLLHTCSHAPQYGATAYIISRAGMAKVLAQTRDLATGRIHCLSDGGGLPGDPRVVPCLSDWALFHALPRAFCVSPRWFTVHLYEGSTRVRAAPHWWGGLWQTRRRGVKDTVSATEAAPAMAAGRAIGDGLGPAETSARSLGMSAGAGFRNKPNDHLDLHYQYVVAAVADLVNDAWLEAALAAPVAPSYRHPMPHVFPFVYWSSTGKEESSTIGFAVLNDFLDFLDHSKLVASAGLISLVCTLFVLLFALSAIFRRMGHDWRNAWGGDTASMRRWRYSLTSKLKALHRCFSCLMKREVIA